MIKKNTKYPSFSRSIIIQLNISHFSPYIQVNHIYSINSFRSTNISKSHLHMQTLSTTFELKWCINLKTPTFSQSKKYHIPLFLNHEMNYKSNER